MQDQFFEWDDLKATRNWLDHAVTFETAKFAFEDAFGIERADLREDYGEDRFNLLGIVDGRLIHVTYTMRGDKIRIISARGAEPYERRLYHEENH